MKSNRLGLGTGKGKGYKNLTHYDPHVHYLAGRGVKIYQPIFSNIPMEHKPLELSLYVPSTQGEKKRIDKAKFNKRIKDAETKMSKMFGGYTQVDTQGGWIGSTGLVKEPVARVTSFTSEEDFENNKAKFEKYVSNISKKYEQESVSIEFEGDLYFYEPNRDTDGDGVVDSKDCSPLDPTKQDLLKDAEVGSDRLLWYSQWFATPATGLFSDKKFWKMIEKYPHSPDRDKDGIPDDLDLEVKQSRYGGQFGTTIPPK
jgi:hypothetical protein